MATLGPRFLMLWTIWAGLMLFGLCATPAHAEPVYNDVDVRLAIAEAADTYGIPENRLLRVASCEASLNPYAVGDSGHSFGLAQLNDRRTGLLTHFLSLGYTSAFNPYAAADYMGRAFSGEFAAEGIGAWRWSCR